MNAQYLTQLSSIGNFIRSALIKQVLFFYFTVLAEVRAAAFFNYFIFSVKLFISRCNLFISASSGLIFPLQQRSSVPILIMCVPSL